MDDHWARFRDGLALTLAGLSERTMVTISWSSVPTVYLQFAQTTEGLTVRTGAEDLLPDSAVPSALTDLGWQSPRSDPLNRRTWHAVLAWPARSVDYDRLAESCVRTLADVHQVPSPDELEYRAHRDGQEPPVGVTFYEEDLEPAEPHLVLDRLGIHDANALPVDD